MSKKKKRLLIYCILAGIGAAIALSDWSFGTLGLLLSACAAVGIGIEFFTGLFL